MRRAHTYLLLGILLMPISLCLAGDGRTRQLVLVAAAESPISPLSPKQLRSLYMGTSLTASGINLRPLLNTSDAYLYEVFLQKVVSMSARHYERHLLGLTFRGKHQHMAGIEDIDTLADILRDTPGAVSFMRVESLKELSDLRVIQVIWTEPTP